MKSNRKTNKAMLWIINIAQFKNATIHVAYKFTRHRSFRFIESPHKGKLRTQADWEIDI